jgi:hypothetical protein
MMEPHLLAVLVVEILFAAAVWTGFVVHYQVTTQGRWRNSPHGRNVMSLALCLAVMIDLTLLSAVVNAEWLLFAALLLWPALTLVGLHRHRLLWRDQHDDDTHR